MPHSHFNPHPLIALTLTAGCSRCCTSGSSPLSLHPTPTVVQLPEPKVLLVRIKGDSEARAAVREREQAWLAQHGGSGKRARAALVALKQEEPQ